MDFLKLLRAFLANVYKMQDGEIDALLTASEATDETALTALLAKDKDRVTTLLAGKKGQTFQDGYKKAKGEVLTQFEKDLREKYGIEDGEGEPLTGIELVAAIIEKEAPEAGKGQITEDVIKKHPTYIKLEKEKLKAVADKEKEWKAKYEDLEKGHKKSTVFSEIKGQALSKLADLGPVLSENAKVAANQQNAWLQVLSQHEYEIGEDGGIIVMKDGKRLEDGHGNPVEFDDFIKSTADGYFDFKQNNGGSNPGSDKDKSKKDEKGGKKYPAGVTKPKTLDDLTKLMNDDKIKVEDKNIIMDTWQEENPGK